jgi:hypothetical protein
MPKLDEDMRNTREHMKAAEGDLGEWTYKPSTFDRMNM